MFVARLASPAFRTLFSLAFGQKSEFCSQHFFAQLIYAESKKLGSAKPLRCPSSYSTFCFIDSGLNNYIVRRFVATSSGVFFVYPGTPSPPDFEPTRQDWFDKAKRFPDRVTMTLPRLDPGGSGFIISLSQVKTCPNYVFESLAFQLKISMFKNGSLSPSKIVSLRRVCF